MLRPAVRRRRRRWTCLRRTWTGRPGTQVQRVRLRSCRDKPNRRDRTGGGSSRGRRGGAANKLSFAPTSPAGSPKRAPALAIATTSFSVHPPTFSNLKAGRRTWTCSARPRGAAHQCLASFADGGVAVFSLCNLRTFKPAIEELGRCGVELEDITARTIPSRSLSETLVSTSVIWCAEINFRLWENRVLQSEAPSL